MRPLMFFRRILSIPLIGLAMLCGLLVALQVPLFFVHLTRGFTPIESFGACIEATFVFGIGAMVFGMPAAALWTWEEWRSKP